MEAALPIAAARDELRGARHSCRFIAAVTKTGAPPQALWKRSDRSDLKFGLLWRRLRSAVSFRGFFEWFQRKLPVFQIQIFFHAVAAAPITPESRPVVAGSRGTSR